MIYQGSSHKSMARRLKWVENDLPILSLDDFDTRQISINGQKAAESAQLEQDAMNTIEKVILCCQKTGSS